MPSPRLQTRQNGTSLIEVLVTLVVLAVGLMGLVGLQSRLQVTEMESYQRAQAVILLEDMVSRMTVNRSARASYVTGDTALGPGTCPSTDSTQVQRDLSEWCNALQGASATTSSGTNKVGGMINARGCIHDLTNNEYMITVVWQGLIPVNDLPSSVSCGATADYSGGACTGANSTKCRRAVTAVVNLSPL